MLELSKKTRKRLRELKAIAYTKELDQYLLKLSAKFDEWKGKKIDCWDLNDQIHKFHDGISRDLFNAYNARSVHDAYMVGRGLALGFLHKDDIPEEVIDWVDSIAKTFFKNNTET